MIKPIGEFCTLFETEQSGLVCHGASGLDKNICNILKFVKKYKSLQSKSDHQSMKFSLILDQPEAPGPETSAFSAS